MIMKKIFLIILCTFLTSIESFAANENQLNVTSTEPTLVDLLLPQYISDVNGRFFVEGQAIPSDKAYMVVRWQDDESHEGNAVSIAPTYDPSAYTGFRPEGNDLSAWQRGEYDIESSGTPVFQLQGYGGGMLMNSWATTYVNVRGGGANTVYGYNFSQKPSVWNIGNEKLWVQADLKLPWFSKWDINNNGNAPVGQLSFIVYLWDTSQNQPLCILSNIFDNRPNRPAETIMNDTYVYFASSNVDASRYTTKNQYSGRWRSTTWNESTFYRMEITGQNIINFARDCNAKYGTTFSLKPQDYTLESASLLQETFRESGDQISMGSSFTSFSVHIYAQ